MIEIYKHQSETCPMLLHRLKTAIIALLFILDDLSFEEHEIEYKFPESS